MCAGSQVKGKGARQVCLAEGPGWHRGGRLWGAGSRAGAPGRRGCPGAGDRSQALDGPAGRPEACGLCAVTATAEESRKVTCLGRRLPCDGLPVGPLGSGRDLHGGTGVRGKGSSSQSSARRGALTPSDLRPLVTVGRPHGASWAAAGGLRYRSGPRRWGVAHGARETGCRPRPARSPRPGAAGGPATPRGRRCTQGASLTLMGGAGSI